MRVRHLSLLLLAAASVALLAGAARAADLPQAQPEELGLSSPRLERMTEFLRGQVQAGVMPGAVMLIARHGKIGYFKAVGALDPSGQTPMTTDAIFRIYSMSKPITTVAALMLAEAGQITFDDPVAKYLPQFAHPVVAVARQGGGDGPLESEPAARPMTLQDLMRHTAGLTYGFFGDTPVKRAYAAADLFHGDFNNAEFVDRLARLPLAYQPGTVWDYSHATDVLGRVIEVVANQSLSAFETEQLLAPLGMVDTGFSVTDTARQGRIAEPFPNDRSLGTGIEVNDPRKGGRWESGGGGMVATAMDYARFAQMLLNGGTLDGRRYLSPRTLAYATSDQLGSTIRPGPYYLPGPGYGFGLGFAVRTAAGGPAYPGDVGDFYWGGVAGTYFWVDPKADMVVVFMMQAPKNRVHMRSLLRDMVTGAMLN